MTPTLSAAVEHRVATTSTNPREGTIRVVGTEVSVWEEPCDEKGMRVVFRQLLGTLHARGFALERDPRTVRNYPTIADWHYVGRKGDLWVTVETCGRTASAEFFQERNVQNKNGGRYDHNKFERLPRDLRLLCVVEMGALVRKALGLGYRWPERAQYGGEVLASSVLRCAEGRYLDQTPLGRFNRQWQPDRFKRDETGWPAESEYNSWHCYGSEDGHSVRNGQAVYFRDQKGRLGRCVAHREINGGLALSTHGVPHWWPNLDVWVSYPGGPRKFCKDHRVRLEQELKKATEAKVWRRVAVLARELEREDAR